MGWLLLLPLVIGLAVALGIALRHLHSAPHGGYRAKKPLSEPEQVLFWRLREAMPECVVLSQVSFSRFIEPIAASVGVRQGLFNKVSRKTVDFIICLPDFTLVAAVELDDRSHQPARDNERDGILKSAGVPILRMNVREIPSVEQLKAMFTK